MNNDLKLVIEQEKTVNIPIMDMLMSFSYAIDLIEPMLSGHQIRVAYIALKIAEKYNLPNKQIEKLVIAACIHDIGVTTAKEKNYIMEHDYKSDGTHEIVGYNYINQYDRFKDSAKIVRHHHLRWNNGIGKTFNGEEVPIESHILYLADRIDTYINKSDYILFQVDYIKEKISEKKDTWFKPELVDAFLELSDNESFWLYVVSSNLEKILYDEAKLPEIDLSIDDLYEIARWFSNIIDFRSRFTSVHSRGVATSASALAKVIGLKEDEVRIMEIAGFFHDLGKLAVSNEILEKNGKLDHDEFLVIKCHTFHTYNVLSRIKDIDYINQYASYHHERIDGNGYPFHIKGENITLGARILAIADIFTAIAEDRPYRIGMQKEQVIKVISEKGDDNCLDSKLVKIFIDNYDEINFKRIEAQNTAMGEYEKFWKEINSEIHKN